MDAAAHISETLHIGQGSLEGRVLSNGLAAIARSIQELSTDVVAHLFRVEYGVLVHAEDGATQVYTSESGTVVWARSMVDNHQSLGETAHVVTRKVYESPWVVVGG